MGLASKLAAAQGGAAAVANFTGQQGGGGQQPPPQQGGSYPGQGQYQAYPGGQSHTTDHTRIHDHMPLASRLAAGGAGAGAPPPSQSPYPAPLQPGRPQNTGYQSPAPGGYPGQSGGYQSPAPGGYPGQQAPYGQPPQQQQYSRPPPPPPGQGGSPYPGAASPYPGQAQPYGAPPQQQQQYGQSPGYPPQGPPGGGYGGYGGPPPGQQPGYPPQGQQQGYGAPPPGGQPGYGGGPPADIQTYVRQLEQAIQEKQLQAFYRPGDPRLQGIAQRAAQQVDRLCQAWKIQREIAMDIVRLALYDVVIYIDDSGSMAFEENGERIDDLKLIMQRVAFAATLFDDDGIDIRFMNDDQIPENMLSGVRTEQQIHQILGPKKYKGLTPFGTKLREKVVDGIVLPKLRQPRKPILVIGITDGQPAGENADTLMQTIRYAVQQTQNLGPGAVAFEFAQVGNDQKATEFLAKLDNDPGVGGMVDCTSNYENESAEMSRAQPPVDLTPDLWMLKLILGAIDPSYDTKDEKGNMAGGGMSPGGHPPGPGGYGGPPQYGGQQQYGAPPGPPPGQGGYPGQQQYGAPPGPPPGQGQYGRPPPGPPPGQGGYGAPPPPQYGGGPPRY